MTARRRPARRSAGRGSIYPDKTRDRWVGQAPATRNYRTGGTRRRKLIGQPGESYAAFEARFDRFVAEVAGSSPTAPVTVGELVARWQVTLDPRAPGQSQGNVDRIASQVRNHITGVIDDIPLAAFTVDDVEAWLASRTTKSGEPLARSTVKKLRSILAQSYDLAIKRRYLDWNPARVADLPKSAETKRTGRALTESEIDAVMQVILEDRLAAWFIVAVQLGLRPGEVSGLTWDSVDFDRNVIVVHQALTRDKARGLYLKSTKTGKTRTLEMPAATRAALEARRVDHEDERETFKGVWPKKWADLVFVTRDGTPMDRSNTRRWVQRVARAAGITGSVTSYDLRHTASEFLASRVSMERLADLMGHRDTDTVQRYYRHPETNVIDVAAEAWNQRTA